MEDNEKAQYTAKLRGMAIILVSTVKVQYDLLIIVCAFIVWSYFSIKAYEKKKHVIPTSPQWKGLVPPVVQLYTMTFLGLGEKDKRAS